MTAVQILSDTKAERLTDNFAPQERIDADEPETPLEWYERWCRRADEHQKQAGLLDKEPLSMEEIVAICKKVRAERYEREQKNTNCR
ncbi:MAG: hypothetical protein LBI05_01750 [Planctomycetaceae bacterium]|jgi:hypothetical protein|nr:hypothetical protein [Planctomycetaceae bacterium]